jgi:peptidoglycan hydrolase CwlO-like protein
MVQSRVIPTERTATIVVMTTKMDFTTILTIISSVATGTISFFLGLRKGKAETEGIVISNLERSVGLYQTILDDMKKELEQLRMEVDKLESKVQELLKENAELKKIMLNHDKKSEERATKPSRTAKKI